MRSFAGAIALAGLTGCLWTPADFAPEQTDIERATGFTLTPSESMHVGPGTLALARGWTKSSQDDVVHHIHRVEFGTFAVKGGKAARAVAAFRAGPGWTPVARVREKGSSVRVFLDEGTGNTGRLFVVASEGQELTFVRLEGKLDRLLEDALAGRWTHEDAARR